MLATLGQRLWSAFFDALAIVAWIVGMALLQPWPDALPGAARAIVWFLPPVLVEPTSIRFLGRTPGQSLLGLRVLAMDGAKLGFPRLCARHFTKAALLGFSLLYLPFSNRRQAIHDTIFGTLVVTEPMRPDFVVPPAGPPLWGPFILALVAASISSLLLGTLLVAAFELSPLDKTPGTLIASISEFLISLAMSGVFMATVIRKGHKARAGRLPNKVL